MAKRPGNQTPCLNSVSKVGPSDETAVVDTVDPVEAALADALDRASKAGEWAVVGELAAQLDQRRRDRAGVVDIETARRAKRSR